MNDLRTGGCLCGAARYEINLDRSRTVTCHCRDCQKQTGAPFLMSTVVGAGQFRWINKPTGVVQTSEKAIRRFCKTCGIPLTWEWVKKGDWDCIYSATLDDPAGLTVRSELFTRSRMESITPFQGAKQYLEWDSHHSDSN